MIVALHGFGGSARDFDLIAARLEGASIEALDLRSPSFDVGRDALRDRVALGYSMGARIALRAALSWPGLIRGLVLVGGTAGIEDAGARTRRRAEDAALAETISRIGVEAFAERWAQAPLIRSQVRMPQPYRDQLLARRRRAAVAELVACLNTVGQGVFEPLWGVLHQLKTPTLLITGDEDQKYTAIARRLCAAIPRAEHAIVAGAGHAAHFERPGAFVELLSSFVAKLGPARGPADPGRKSSCQK